MPLWGLSKLVSLGLTGLGSSGIGIYFAPLFSEKEGNLFEKVYDSGGNLNNIFPLLESEKILISQLSELYRKFKLAFEEIITKKELKLSEIKENFQEVSLKESELESKYKSSEKLIQELGRIMKSKFETNEKKLDMEAALKSFQVYSKLMSQANSFMHEWGSSLKKFICAIDNKGEASDCESKSQNWLKTQENSQQTISIDSSGGGHWKF